MCLPDVMRSLATQHIASLITRGVAQVDEAKEETDSGLLLTSASKEQPTIGKVCTPVYLPLLCQCEVGVNIQVCITLSPAQPASPCASSLSGQAAPHGTMKAHIWPAARQCIVP